MIFVLLCSELISFSLCLLLCMSTMLVNKLDQIQRFSPKTQAMRVILGKLDILLHLQLSSKLNTFPRDEDENSSYTAINTVGCSPTGVHRGVFTAGRSPTGVHQRAFTVGRRPLRRFCNSVAVSKCRDWVIYWCPRGGQAVTVVWQNDCASAPQWTPVILLRRLCRVRTVNCSLEWLRY